MSTEKDKHAAEESETSPAQETPDVTAVASEVQELLRNLNGVRDLLSRGHWPVATVEMNHIVLKTQGAVYTESSRNIAGEWRTVINPGGVIGAMPGSEWIPGALLTEIASDWHANSEDAYAQALRRYCDLSVGPEVK